MPRVARLGASFNIVEQELEIAKGSSRIAAESISS
jgi:hypothetical protein